MSLENEPFSSPDELRGIERYLFREMTEAECRAFEKRLEAEPELNSKTKELSLLMQGVHGASLRKRPDDHRADPMYGKGNGAMLRKKGISIKQWAAAAAVLLVFGFSVWFFKYRQSPEEALFAAYYKPDPGLITAKSIMGDDAFDRAMAAYKTGHYDAALTVWKDQLTAKPDNDTLLYFIGAAWLAKNDPANSIQNLRKVVPYNTSYFYSDANWYLGMALLKEKRAAEAIQFIEASGHPQKETLLSQLRK